MTASAASLALTLTLTLTQRRAAEGRNPKSNVRFAYTACGRLWLDGSFASFLEVSSMRDR